MQKNFGSRPHDRNLRGSIARACASSVIALLLASAGAAFGEESDTARKPAHVASSECVSCHREADPSWSHQTHATGVDYEEARGRRALRAPASRSGFGGTVAEDFLVDGRVECTSCHYSHTQETTTPARLRLPAASMHPAAPGVRAVTTSLCVNCHDMSRM